MALTILYHNPERPNEAGMTMITDRTVTTEVIRQLEKRGFVVDKITARPSPKTLLPI